MLAESHLSAPDLARPHLKTGTRAALGRPPSRARFPVPSTKAPSGERARISSLPPVT